MTVSTAPTLRQHKILSWIAAYVARMGYAPTVREIGDGLGIISPNGVMSHLRALERKKLLTWTRGSARTIKLSWASERSGLDDVASVKVESGRVVLAIGLQRITLAPDDAYALAGELMDAAEAAERKKTR